MPVACDEVVACRLTRSDEVQCGAVCPGIETFSTSTSNNVRYERGSWHRYEQSSDATIGAPGHTMNGTWTLIMKYMVSW